MAARALRPRVAHARRMPAGRTPSGGQVCLGKLLCPEASTTLQSAMNAVQVGALRGLHECDPNGCHGPTRLLTAPISPPEVLWTALLQARAVGSDAEFDMALSQLQV
jgi:hypothetical protein